jgi:hypothetical protein
MPAFIATRLAALASAGLILSPLPASAQAVAPQVQGAPAVPGLQSVPNAAAAANAPKPEPKVVKTEVERQGRPNREVFIATYLTLSRDCKVGPNPRLEVSQAPKNGKVYTRANAINLRAVPGAPRTNCIGTSPSGLGVFFRPERRFAGTETFTFKIIYPDGDIREVAAKIVIE